MLSVAVAGNKSGLWGETASNTPNMEPFWEQSELPVGYRRIVVYNPAEDVGTAPNSRLQRTANRPLRLNVGRMRLCRSVE